jgi:hypothetical protein
MPDPTPPADVLDGELLQPHQLMQRFEACRSIALDQFKRWAAGFVAVDGTRLVLPHIGPVTAPRTTIAAVLWFLGQLDAVRKRRDDEAYRAAISRRADVREQIAAKERELDELRRQL